MSRLATSFVLGYHGCDAEFAAGVLNGRAAMTRSENEWDWLGKGAYFWESDPVRAFEWACEKAAGPQSTIKDPAVLGAAIDLGNCLDLTSRADLELVREAHTEMAALFHVLDMEMPRNRPGRGMRIEDLHLRKLDNAVINFLHDRMKARDAAFDTARAPFIEGDELYAGSKFHQKTHIQIAVLNLNCIKGFFYPPDFHATKTKALAARALS